MIARAPQPQVVERNGQRYLLNGGRELRIIVQGEGDDAFLSYAAVTIEFGISVKLISKRQRRGGPGWRENDDKPLKIYRRRVPDTYGRKVFVRFLRRGDVAHATAVPKKREGDTARRFMFEGTMRWTKTEACEVLAHKCKDKLDELCKRYKFDFIETRSPETGRWVEVCDGATAQRILDDINKPKSAPPKIDGPPTITISQGAAILELGISRYLLRQLELEKRIARIQTSGRGRFGGVLYYRDNLKIEVAKLKERGTAEMYQDEAGEWWFTVRAAAKRHGVRHTRIHDAIGRGDLHCDYRTMPGTITARERMVRDNDVQEWLKRGRKKKYAGFGGVYDTPDGRRLTLKAAGCLPGSSPDRIKHAVRLGQLEARFDIRPGTLLREQTVLEADVLDFLKGKPAWTPPSGFLSRKQLIARCKIPWKSAARFAFDHLLTELRQKLREGLDYAKSPNSPAIFYRESVIKLLQERNDEPLTVEQRQALWLHWKESERLGDAKIRDRWNRLYPRQRIDDGARGRDLVKQGIKRARNARQKQAISK